LALGLPGLPRERSKKLVVIFLFFKDGVAA